MVSLNSILASAYRYPMHSFVDLDMDDGDLLNYPPGGKWQYWVSGDPISYGSMLIRSAACKIFILESENKNDHYFHPNVEEITKDNRWLKDRIFIADKDGQDLRKIKGIFKPIVSLVEEIKTTPSRKNRVVHFRNGNSVPFSYVGAINNLFDLTYRIYLGVKLQAEVDLEIKQNSIAPEIFDPKSLSFLDQYEKNTGTRYLLDQLLGITSLYRQSEKIPSIEPCASNISPEIGSFFDELFRASTFLKLSQERHRLGYFNRIRRSAVELKYMVKRILADANFKRKMKRVSQTVDLASSISGVSANIDLLNIESATFVPPIVDLSRKRVDAETQGALALEREARERYSKGISNVYARKTFLDEISPTRFAPDWGIAIE